MIRVVLPAHLKTLVKTHGEIELDVVGVVTQRSVVDALETRYPVLLGTIRDPTTKKRRAFVRFYVCEEDISHDDPEARLPEAVVDGAEPFFVIGAMAGG
ncbi:MAG TPA: MoaD/ThiS family protein [Acidimicrobiales bacterium]|nr:MoaD/ThiS family protein [Acidimicrobiales bacterium]